MSFDFGKWNEWPRNTNLMYLAVLDGVAEIACDTEEHAQHVLDHFSTSGEIRRIP